MFENYGCLTDRILVQQDRFYMILEGTFLLSQDTGAMTRMFYDFSYLYYGDRD